MGVNVMVRVKTRKGGATSEWGTAVVTAVSKVCLLGLQTRIVRKQLETPTTFRQCKLRGKARTLITHIAQDHIHY